MNGLKFLFIYLFVYLSIKLFKGKLLDNFWSPVESAENLDFFCFLFINWSNKGKHLPYPLKSSWMGWKSSLFIYSFIYFLN